MSQANVDLVRSLIPPAEVDLAALFREDELFAQAVEPLAELIHPEVESVAVLRAGPTYRGIEGFRRLWLDWLEPWSEYHSHLDQLIDAGDCVVLLVKDRARRAGVRGEFEVIAGSTWEVRDRKIVRVVFYDNREDALSAPGVDER